MRPILALLLASVLGLCAGVGLMMYRHRGLAPYPVVRAAFVVQQAQGFGDADTLIIGDSLVEQANMEGVCGRTFSAGVGGARIRNIFPIAPALVAATHPKTIVVAIGANHFANGNEIETFRTAYPQFVHSLPKVRLILVGVINSPEGSAIVQQTARSAGVFYIPPTLGPLRDGLHHTVAGSRGFRASIAAACQAPAR